MRNVLVRAGGIGSLIVGLLVTLTVLAQGISQEVPIGAVTGVVTMKENGRPLEGADVYLSAELGDRDAGAYTRRAATDKNGVFRFRGVVAGAHRIECSSKAHSLKPSVIQVAEGRTETLSLELKPNEPSLDLYCSQRVVTPDEKANLQLFGFVPDTGATVEIYRVDWNATARAGGLREVFTPLARTDPTQQFTGDQAVLAQSLPHTFSSRDVEGTFREDLTLPNLAEGLYWVRVKTSRLQKGTYLAVSRIGLVTKSGQREQLHYVMDLKSGTPVSGAAIYGWTGQAKLLGRTNASGLWTGSKADTPNVIWAESGKSRALITTFASEESNASLRVALITDRPVYRPGDVVQFKGVARQRTDDGLKIPGAATAKITMRDPDGVVIEQRDLAVDSHGSFDGSFMLAKGVTGSYELTTEIDGKSSSQYITVASYRKPEFKILITPTQPLFFTGEKVEMRVSCQYYFGGPVPGAKLTGTVYRRHRWSSWLDDSSEYQDYGDDYVGDYIGDVKGETNEQGETTLSFAVPEGKNFWEEDLDEDITFDVSAEEGTGKYFQGRGTARLTQGDVAVALESDDTVLQPGSKSEVGVTVTGLLDEKPRPGTKLRIETGYYDWKGNEMRVAWTSVGDLTTNQDGKALISITPSKSGEFVVQATASDSRGRKVVGRTTYWVDGSGGATNWGPGQQIQLVLDKKRYMAGDTANVLIRSKAIGATALVTLEKSDVVASQVVKITGPITRVRLPLPEKALPNAQVAVALVSNKQFMESARQFGIDSRSQVMKLNVNADRPTAKPGEKVTFTIHAEDQQGRPQAMDVSLGVVDEAIYAIREDRFDPVMALYPREYPSVVTAYSFPELYLDGGDKAPASMEVRQNFLDTAYWAARVRTDAEGNASVTVTMPDNLTAWRATAVAIDDQSACAKAVGSVVVQKDLMVRLAAPMIMTQGDTTVLTATVNSHLTQAAEVKVKLQAPKQLELEGNAEQTVSVEPGGMAQVQWTAKPTSFGPVEMIVSAESSVAGDAMKSTVQVTTHGRPHVQVGSGNLKQPARFTIDRMEGAEAGDVEIRIQPGLAATLMSALPSLVDYPYGCTEQTMSRFMPALVVEQFLLSQGITDDNLKAKIAEVSTQSLARLKLFQHGDGGWGWWEYDESDPRMTAIVLEGLARVQATGLPFNKNLVEGGLRWANNYLKNARPSKFASGDYRLLRAVLALAPTDDLRKLLESVRPHDVGDAIEILGALDSGNAPALAERCDQAITRSLGEDGTFKSSNYRWGLEWESRALDVLLRRNPQDPRAEKLVAGLTQKRRGLSWVNTYDTSQALIGIVAYLRAHPESFEPNEVMVKLNGAERRKLTLEPKAVRAGEEIVTIPIAELKSGPNEFEIVASRPTGLYGYRVEQTPYVQTIGKLLTEFPITIERNFHGVTTERQENNRLALVASKTPKTEFKTGEILRCRVSLKNTGPAWRYVLVEIPTPSNLRVAEREEFETWSYWFTGLQILDDRVGVLIDTLANNEQVIEINYRAESPGVASALPVTIYPMYQPDQRVSTAETRIEVRR